MSFLPSLAPGNVTPVQTTSGAVFDVNIKWERPSEWLDLNVPTGVPEKIIGLIAVHEYSNYQSYVAFDLDTNDNSSFTVDWGDGTTETLTTDTVHSHIYNYNDITGDTSTTKSTTYRGYRQAKFEITPASGSSWSSIDFNKGADGWDPGYTSSDTRANGTILDLFISSSVNTFVRLNENVFMPMVEQIEVRNTPNNRLSTNNKIYRACRSLQSIPFVPYVNDNAVATSYQSAFQYCVNLEAIPDDFADPERQWFKNPTSMFYTFFRCYSLKYLPEGLFGYSEFSNCSSYYGTFYDCRNLKYIPYLPVKTTGGAHDLRYTFTLCGSLRSIPKGYSVAKANTNGLQGTFYGCRNYDLSRINLDEHTGANFSMYRTFQGTSSNLAIKVFPYIGQFTKCNNARDMFISAQSIQRFSSHYTHLDFTNSAGLRGTFQYMIALMELPPIHITNLSSGSDGMFQAFMGAYSLTRIIFVGMTGNTSGEYYRAFRDSASLTYIEGVDFSFANDSGDMTECFLNTRNINYIKFPGGPTDETGFKYSTELRYCPLNRDAILEIFNHLCTITHSATLDLRNNTFTADLTDDDKAIATNKGWTLSL